MTIRGGRFRGPVLCMLLWYLSAPALADEPELYAALGWDPGDALAAAVLDEASGTLLYGYNAEVPHPPASITKVFAVHAALDELLSRGIGPATLVPIPPEAAWYRAPPGSSLMFLEPGHQVRLDELLLGLLVSSGNDAAIALASFSHGSEAGLVTAMNRLASDLGLRATRFVDASGLSPQNQTTAHDLVRFLRVHRERYGLLLGRIYAATGFAYPRQSNLGPDPSRFRVQQTIPQDSRNLLLSMSPDADGIKTGFTEASGYNLAFSATRHGRGVVGAVLGVRAADSSAGSLVRAQIAADLVRTALDGTVLLIPDARAPSAPRLWLADEAELAVTADPWPPVVVPAGMEGDLEYRSSVPRDLLAPVERGVTLGSQTILLDGRVLAERRVRAARGAELAGVLARFQDELILVLTGRSGEARPSAVAGGTSAP